MYKQRENGTIRGREREEGKQWIEEEGRKI
jgi:hypothetical protein